MNEGERTGGGEGALPEASGDPSGCWLCGRALGTRVEAHHPVPKSRGGRETVLVHPICHRALHATFANVELARIGANRDALAEHPAMRRFLSWVSGKSPDFHAPTQPRRARR